MKIFVSGGSGFLGHSLVRCLCALGHQVKSFSRGKYPESEPAGVTHIRGDLRDFDTLKQAMSGCEAVFHTAAKIGMWGRFDDFYQTNVVGTENIIRACRELDIQYLVFSSSPSVVFDGKDCEGQNESLPYPEKFTAWYPQTKAIAEQMVLAANDISLKTTALRPHLIWGPEDNNLLPGLIKKAEKGKLRIAGSGNNRVDCIYIDNAVSAHVRVLEQLLLQPTAVEGKAYFISQGEPIPMADLMNRLVECCGYPPATKHISRRIVLPAGRVLETAYKLLGILSAEPPLTYFLAQQLVTAHWYDISAARRDFGFVPEVSLEEGMKRLKDWCEQRRARSGVL